jgi:hypothetical protein
MSIFAIPLNSNQRAYILAISFIFIFIFIFYFYKKYGYFKNFDISPLEYTENPNGMVKLKKIKKIDTLY